MVLRVVGCGSRGCSGCGVVVVVVIRVVVIYVGYCEVCVDFHGGVGEEGVIERDVVRAEAEERRGWK